MYIVKYLILPHERVVCGTFWVNNRKTLQPTIKYAPCDSHKIVINLCSYKILVENWDEQKTFLFQKCLNPFVPGLLVGVGNLNEISNTKCIYGRIIKYNILKRMYYIF